MEKLAVVKAAEICYNDINYGILRFGDENTMRENPRSNQYRREEQRPLTFAELKNVRLQVYTIKQSMQKRIANGIYTPNEKEQANALTTLRNLQRHLAASRSREIIFLAPYQSRSLVSSM